MTAEDRYLSYSIPEDAAGRSVLSFLERELGLSGAKIRSLKYRENGILLDGKWTRTDTKVRGGERLEILMTDAPARKSVLRAAGASDPLPPPDILWEDAFLLAVNKPAGLVCHPSRGHFGDSLAMALRIYLDRREPEAGVHFLGRLDKDSSGLLLIAKNALVADRFFGSREAGSWKKTYLAVVRGHFPEEGQEGSIRLPLQPYTDEKDILRMRACPAGTAAERTVLPARSDYSVLRQLPAGNGLPERSLVQVRIATGRMHQIRCHFAALGHPLLGDRLYGTGENGEGISRTALHAGQLDFIHPMSGEALRFTAKLPEDMEALL